jgi:hypothetical protein
VEVLCGHRWARLRAPRPLEPYRLGLHPHLLRCELESVWRPPWPRRSLHFPKCMVSSWSHCAGCRPLSFFPLSQVSHVGQGGGTPATGIRSIRTSMVRNTKTVRHYADTLRCRLTSAPCRWVIRRGGSRMRRASCLFQRQTLVGYRRSLSGASSGRSPGRMPTWQRHVGEDDASAPAPYCNKAGDRLAGDERMRQSRITLGSVPCHR